MTLTFTGAPHADMCSNCTVWLTVCTPPGCSPRHEPTLAYARRTIRLPLVVLDCLQGRETWMAGQSRTRKLTMIRDYLRSSEGRRWQWVVYADAMDVIAGSGSEPQLHAALSALGAANDGKLVASAEPACWVGEACSETAIRSMQRLSPVHFAKPHPQFPCSGQYAGSAAAVLAFATWGVAALEAPSHATPVRGALGDPPLDDQGLLIAYWLAHPGQVVVDDGAVIFGNLARWYVLEAELRTGRRGGGGSAAAAAALPPRDVDGGRSRGEGGAGAEDARRVPWCSALDGGRRRFATGHGHYCSDAFNLEGFSLACDADRRCDVRYAATELKAAPADARRGRFRRRRYAAAKVDGSGGTRGGGEVLEPLLGWHGPGHNGKTLFRPLWRRLQHGWPAFANASVLAAPRVGICGETSVGEGDCARGWWGSWRGADYGISLRGDEGRRNCLALCRQCARCAFISYSHANDDCSWYAACYSRLPRLQALALATVPCHCYSPLPRLHPLAWLQPLALATAPYPGYTPLPGTCSRSRRPSTT